MSSTNLGAVGDGVRRFDDRADDYARFRPGYPDAAIDAIVHGLGPCDKLVVADIGAGTGISSERVAQRGARVIAVEPNPAMRAMGERSTIAGNGPGRVRFVDGHAEATGLADASVDIALAAQAFHWFRVPEAVAELARIVRPAGRLALVWNVRDPDDPVSRAYYDTLDRHGAASIRELIGFDPAVVSASGAFRGHALRRVANEQLLDRAGLIGRAMSASYVPKQGPGHDAIVRELGGVFDVHRRGDGVVRLGYVCDVHTWERAGPITPDPARRASREG